MISWECAKANYTLYKVIKNILIDPVFKDLNTIHIVYNYMHEYMNMLVHSIDVPDVYVSKRFLVDCSEFDTY